MDFEVLKDFDWYNEPQNVRFERSDLVIYAKSNTDFWQSSQHNFFKDNAHFFYCEKENDFDIILKWQFKEMDKFSQCGLMLRIDEKNWLKASIMSESLQINDLGSSLTINGHSDWCSFDIKRDVEEIWFRLTRVDNDYILYYSLNGINFIKMRLFFLSKEVNVLVGAYIASPNVEDFNAVLSELKFI